VDADGLGGGDGKADGEDVAARDGDGTTTGGGALVLGWLAAGETVGDTLAGASGPDWPCSPWPACCTPWT
jgi:hypothetical protein